MHPDQMPWAIPTVAAILMLGVITALVVIHGARQGHLGRTHRIAILGLSIVELILIYAGLAVPLLRL